MKGLSAAVWTPNRRKLAAVGLAPLQPRHYRAIRRMYRRSPAFIETLWRYLLKRGDYPWDCRVLTSVGPVTFTLLSPDDMLTVNEVFFREDYPVPPNLGCVVDIGANVGVTAAFFLAYGGATTCYAFEPNPVNLERLRAHLQGFEDRLVISDAAVGTRNATATFGVEPTGRYGGIGVETGQQIEVTMRDINDVLEEILGREDRIDLVKVDIEGLELPVVSSIRPHLLSRIDRIYFEHEQPINPHPAAFRLEFSSMTCRLLRRRD